MPFASLPHAHLGTEGADTRGEGDRRDGRWARSGKGAASVVPGSTENPPGAVVQPQNQDEPMGDGGEQEEQQEAPQSPLGSIQHPAMGRLLPTEGGEGDAPVGDATAGSAQGNPHATTQPGEAATAGAQGPEITSKQLTDDAMAAAQAQGGSDFGVGLKRSRPDPEQQQGDDEEGEEDVSMEEKKELMREQGHADVMQAADAGAAASQAASGAQELAEHAKESAGGMMNSVMGMAQQVKENVVKPAALSVLGGARAVLLGGEDREGEEGNRGEAAAREVTKAEGEVAPEAAGTGVP